MKKKAAAALVFLAAAMWGFYLLGGMAASRFSPAGSPPAGAVQADSPETPLSDLEWDAMVSALSKASIAYPGRVGIYLKDLRTGRSWAYQPDRLFPSASLIKVPIMTAVFDKIARGELALEARIRLTGKDRRGGSGSLKWAREGTSLSVMELLYKMITESDNTATQMIIDHVGYSYLEYSFRKIGLVYTNITPEGMSLTSGRVARENYTTPREMALLVDRIYAGAMIDKGSSQLMLDLMKHNKGRTRLRKGLPMGWEIGHKTGLLRRSCHDVGVVFSPRGDYIIAVLTSEVPSYASAKRFIAGMARLTYGYYNIDVPYTAAGRSRNSNAI
ncbi:MAG: beta-lactamase [Elusimicrobia bacterium]|nr:MAG: beta-lactamase [Elusimicrobiota bacterium]KAF0155475.1 MAG: beta-lactamase [Elusimicrobiota bacterium]